LRSNEALDPSPRRWQNLGAGAILVYYTPAKQRKKAMSRTKFTSFAELADLDDLSDEHYKFNTLSVVPRRRHYLSAVDAIYDFSVGHDFLVRDPTSPFDGCFISILDTTVLRQNNYTSIDISYNNDRSVEVAL
jgi:hypothetical protein